MDTSCKRFSLRFSQLVVCHTLFLLITCGTNSVFSFDDVLNTVNGTDKTFVEDDGVTATTQHLDTVTTAVQTGSRKDTTHTNHFASTNYEEHDDGGNSVSRANSVYSSTGTTLPGTVSTSQHFTGLNTGTFTFPFVTRSFVTELWTMQAEFSLYNPYLSDMKDAMKMKKITDYLAKFTNRIQRTVVKNQLQFCPYISLCNFDEFARPIASSCCEACDCDIDICVENNTCCPSVLSEDIYTLPNDTDPKISKQRSTDMYTTDTICVSKHLSHQTGTGFEAIATCPGGVNTELHNLCTMVYTRFTVLSNSVPVSCRTTQKLFRNKYCAKCNAVADNDIVNFIPIFSCSNLSNFEKVTRAQDAISLSYSNTDCDIVFVNNDIELHECEYVIDKCNVTGIWKTYDPVFEMACSLYTSKMYHYGVKYNNVFCALCNGIEPRVTCNSDYPVKSWVFGFSGLLALDSDQALVSTEPPTIKDLESSCSSKQFYDVLFELCKNISCPENAYYHRGSCVPTFTEVTSNMMYVVDMRLLPKAVATVEEILAVELDLFKEIHEALYFVDKRFEYCFLEMAFKTDMIYSQRYTVNTSSLRLPYVDIRMKLLLSAMVGSQSPNLVVDSILAMRHYALKIYRMNDVPLEFQIVFTQFDTRQFNLIELVHTTREIRDSLHNKYARERLEILSQFAFPDHDGFMIIPNSADISVNLCMESDKEIPVLNYASCPKVHVSSNDIKWTSIDDGIFVDELKIDRGNFYFIDDQNIMMCLEQYEELVEHLLPSRSLNAERIVSIVFSSMSIVSLLITIITFSIFPKLHKSLPGQNNLSLSVALLLAQIMLLVGTLGAFEQYSTACQTIGLIIHFSWLCVVFWMNVCTYHIFVTLTRSELPSKTFDVKKCVSYHVYVLVISMIFVGLNVLLSELESNGLGYGGKYCYITSRQRILITFAAPTFLVVCANLCLFLCVVCRVTKSSGVRKSVKRERNDLVIFAKLATLTGISWIFGFLYIWMNNSALSYIFTILNAGQGIFIMVSFVLNRRVIEMFRELFGRTHTKEPNANHSDINGKSRSTLSTM